MGRKRKALREKTTTILLTIDNDKLFNFCDRFNIPYNDNDLIVSGDIKVKVSAKMLELLQEFTK